MKNKNKHRIWYIYSENGHTNRYVFLELNRTEEYFDEAVEDIDCSYQKVTRNLNLARLNSSEEVELLQKNKKSRNLDFKIFIQDDPGGKIYRWPLDEGARPPGRNSKSR